MKHLAVAVLACLVGAGLILAGCLALAPGHWYLESGDGMGNTLRMANQLDAYTLSDLATYAKLAGSLPYLDILISGDPLLTNPYSILPIPDGPSCAAGQDLYHQLVSPAADQVIASFAIDGTQLLQEVDHPELDYACSAAGSGPVTLATTTSLYDSGLLDLVLADYGPEVRIVSTGSGQAMEIAKRGEIDILLVHAPAAEDDFIANGHALFRMPFANGSFVLVGPTTDPAGVTGGGIIAGLQAIAASQQVFLSRGDDSGTHQKELSLWEIADVEP